MNLQKILFLSVLALLSACVTTGDVKKPTGSPEEAARANFQLGVEYFKKNNIPLAYEKLKRSVNHDATNAQAHAFLALAAEQLNLPDEASRHYKEAIRIDDKDPAVQNMYGAYLCQQGKARQAEQHFMNAANNRFYSTPEAAFDNAGECARKLDDTVKAEEYYRKALQLNPKYTLALWHMAKLSFDLNRDLQARVFLERIGSANILPPEALLLGYQIEQRTGNASGAYEYSRQLKARYPESTQTTQLLESEKNGG